jgi:hypothetical protein
LIFWGLRLSSSNARSDQIYYYMNKVKVHTSHTMATHVGLGVHFCVVCGSYGKSVSRNLQKTYPPIPTQAGRMARHALQLGFMPDKDNQKQGRFRRGMAEISVKRRKSVSAGFRGGDYSSISVARVSLTSKCDTADLVQRTVISCAPIDHPRPEKFVDQKKCRGHCPEKGWMVHEFCEFCHGSARQQHTVHEAQTVSQGISSSSGGKDKPRDTDKKGPPCKGLCPKEGWSMSQFCVFCHDS